MIQFFYNKTIPENDTFYILMVEDKKLNVTEKFVVEWGGYWLATGLDYDVWAVDPDRYAIHIIGELDYMDTMHPVVGLVTNKWELWMTQGQGGMHAFDFLLLERALKYVEDHEGEASFGIKLPDGEWHKWDK